MRLDHTRAPLAEAVRAYRDDAITPFTTPGHKRGRGIPPETATLLGHEAFLNDIPVASGVDDTHMTRDVLGAAERLAADAYGAERSFFLLNGSSVGNQAAILATVGPGDEVVVARNFHKSMLTALILSGARPIYIHPRHDAALEVAHGIVAGDLTATLDAHPRARAALMVSPSYFGVSADVRALAAACHTRGIPLIVDEAWGPHFPFHPGLPPAAMACGADAGVASIHKVLTGFTQSSILNLQGPRIDAARVAAWLGLLQTTSPSAFILASIDACRRQMALHGQALLSQALALGRQARAALAATPGLHALGEEVLGRPGAAALDGTKLVVDVQGTGLSGYEVDTLLRERYHITVEMSDHRRVVALLSIADDEASVGRLVTALREIAVVGERPVAPTTPMVSPADLLTESVLTPREAFFAPSRAVPLALGSGEIAVEVVTPYPPGIPLLAPGERVTAPIVAYLQAGLAAGMHVTGAADPTLATLRVAR